MVYATAYFWVVICKNQRFHHKGNTSYAHQIAFGSIPGMRDPRTTALFGGHVSMVIWRQQSGWRTGLSSPQRMPDPTTTRLFAGHA